MPMNTRCIVESRERDRRPHPHCILEGGNKQAIISLWQLGGDDLIVHMPRTRKLTQKQVSKLMQVTEEEGQRPLSPGIKGPH